MRSPALRRLLHLVLAAAATDAAVACGGAITSVEETGADPNGTPWDDEPSTRPRKPGDDREPDRRPPDPVRDASVDTVPADASVDTVPADAKSDVTQRCLVGSIAPDPDYCCTSNPTTCSGVGNPSAGKCDLDCKKLCDDLGASGFDQCFWSQDPGTKEDRIQYYCGLCGIGRIPDGTGGCGRGGSVGERLAMQAYYEAASVVAFQRLARTLARSGAPRALVQRSLRAAAEERRHARLFARLAERRGAIVPEPSIAPREQSLFAIALENAVEGCVRETYGALVALHQAKHAADPELRAAFAEIADDEIAHAAFSWDLAQWLDSRSSAEQRRMVAEAHERAALELREGATREHDEIDAELGLPDAETGRRLFDDLFARLRAAA